MVRGAKTTEALVSELKGRGLTPQQILEAYHNAPCIPADAFATTLTPFETAAAYLHDHNHTTKEIARALQRSTSSVNNALANAAKKAPKGARIENATSAYLIPTTAFHDARITPAETVVAYLIETYALKNTVVAELLGRDPRNTWHLYQQAQRKRGGRS